MLTTLIQSAWGWDKGRVQYCVSGQMLCRLSGPHFTPKQSPARRTFSKDSQSWATFTAPEPPSVSCCQQKGSLLARGKPDPYSADRFWGQESCVPCPTPILEERPVPPKGKDRCGASSWQQQAQGLTHRQGPEGSRARHTKASVDREVQALGPGTGKGKEWPHSAHFAL